MTQVIETESPPRTPANGRQKGRSSRRQMTSQHRSQLYCAIRGLDPAATDELETEIVAELIAPELIDADEISAPLRNARYERLTPLRATALFAEIYQDWFWFYQPDSDETCGLEDGLPEASLADVRHMWCARQQADALGMEYGDYIRAAFIAHGVRGEKAPPKPGDLYGQLVLMVAANEKQEALSNLEGQPG